MQPSNLHTSLVTMLSLVLHSTSNSPTSLQCPWWRHKNRKQKQFPHHPPPTQTKELFPLEAGIFSSQKFLFSSLTFSFSSLVVFSLNSFLKWRLLGPRIQAESHQGYKWSVLIWKPSRPPPLSGPQSAAFSYTIMSLLPAVCVPGGVQPLKRGICMALLREDLNRNSPIAWL